MKIKELVLHPAQLVDVDLSKVSCLKSEEYDSNKQELGLEVSISSEVISLEKGRANINVLVKGTGFQIEIEESGLFTFSDIESKEVINQFLEIQAVKILWSYIRETIYDLSIRMLKKPILIPTIDVVNTIEKAEKD